MFRLPEAPGQGTFLRPALFHLSRQASQTGYTVTMELKLADGVLLRNEVLALTVRTLQRFPKCVFGCQLQWVTGRRPETISHELDASLCQVVE